MKDNFGSAGSPSDDGSEPQEATVCSHGFSEQRRMLIAGIAIVGGTGAIVSLLLHLSHLPL